MVSFAAPAFAEEIYVVFDPASHKCEAMHNIPDGMKSMGKYGSMDEANCRPFPLSRSRGFFFDRPPTWLPLPLLWLAIVIHHQVHPLLVADLVITAEGRRVTQWAYDCVTPGELLFEKPNKKAPVTVTFWWIAAPSGLALAF